MRLPMSKRARTRKARKPTAKQPTRQVRLRLSLPLTRENAKRLEARATGDVRSVANYVSWVIADSLGSQRRRQRSLDANPREKRTGYDVGLMLTSPEREELRRRAEAERRSLSNYVARLVVEALPH